MGSQAFTTSGITTGAVLIDSVYATSVFDAVFKNKFFGMVRPGGGGLFNMTFANGDTHARWIVRKGAGEPEIFTEGEVAPSPSTQDYAQAAVPWLYARSVVQISGHARDAMRSGLAGTAGIMDVEVASAAEDINDLLATSWLGSTYGLEAAVSSTISYAGVTRGAASWWESYESALSDLLSVNALMDGLEAIHAAERGGFEQGGVVLMPWNQYVNYYNLSGVPGMKTFGTTDAALGLYQQELAGHTVVPVQDMTATTVLFLDAAPGQNELSIIRPFETRDMAPSGDSDLVQISCGGALLHRNPVKSGKLTSVTA